MKIVDNFNLLKKMMNFTNDDEFYFVQILVRGKDGHSEQGVNGNNKNRLVKFYTIKSVEHLQRLEPEIKVLCKAVNGRAYIHPTKRSFKEVADETLKVTTETYLSKNVTGLKGAYSTACGKSFVKSDKKFVIDLDGEDVNKINEIAEFLEDKCQPVDKLKLQYIVPTAHGKHLITLPFDTRKFSEKFPNVDIHKNNPTLLYFECLE